MSTLACQASPFLQSLDTKVVSCKPYTLPAAPKKKKKKKNKSATPDEGKQEQKTLFQIVLEDTVLFPEGGGQPCDFGRIGDARVSNAFHDAQGDAVHVTDAPFEVGASVHVTVDWARRTDHMQHHTAQHLVSALFRSMYDAPTISWWLASAPAECNIELDTKQVTQEQLDAVNARLAAIITDARAIHIHKIDSIADAAAHAYFQANPHKLPSPKEGQTASDPLKSAIRLIEIEGVEHNMCCGTHLQDTSQLRHIVLTKADTIKGHARIHFVAGNRAIEACTRALLAEKRLTGVLSVAAPELVERAEQWRDEIKNLNRSNTRLIEELARVHAQTDAKNQANPVVCRIQGDSTPAYQNAYCRAVVEADNTRVAVCFITGPAEASHCTPSDAVVSQPATMIHPGSFLVLGTAATEAQVTEIGAAVCTALGCKGGGRKGKFQGKIGDLSENQYKLATAALEQTIARTQTSA